MAKKFFSMLFRMKYLNRWSLMRNNRYENLSEHSFDTAVIAHSLAIIKNKFFSGNLNPEKLATMALYHDASEIITGDLPTPIKYKNPEINSAYKNIEKSACRSLLSLLGDDIKSEYEDYILQNINPCEKQLIKTADKISALIKCIEEEQCGNFEFVKAKQSILKAIDELNSPEADYFLKHYIPMHNSTLDDDIL